MSVAPRSFPKSIASNLLATSFATMMVIAASAARSSAQPPPGYYDSVNTANGATLRATLHPVIDDHTRYPYTSTATDTWNILEQADEDPGNPSNVLDVYKNASYVKVGAGNTNYNREHSWPNSYGYPNDGSTNYPYTDCHALFIADDSYNTSRSNKPYRFCSAACSEQITLLTNGQGGGSGVYPGNSNWTTGSFTTGTWETWVGRRGDVARALLYLDVRYEGGTHGITGVAEPDMILTDNEALIDASNTGSNLSVAYMGMLSVLLQWHQQDPVDAKEISRNNVVASYQGNRNPFIDHPEWVECIWNASCGGDTTPPTAPTGLAATPGNNVVNLDWNDNTEPDLAGYNVYRSTTSGGPYTKLNTGLVAASAYSDTTASNGTTYYYVVTAQDTANNESNFSNQASATPSGGGPATPWINEFHYDNDGTDTGEFVEVAGPSGTDLTGWKVIGYNGSGGATYATVNLSGTIPDQQSCIGTRTFAFAAMQNGSPDGLALVNASNVVIQFISYEGAFTATDGPAIGLISTDIGVSEATTTPVGQSLQLAGSGKQYSDFTWQAPATATSGQKNTGQTFSDPACVDTTPPAAPTGLAATAGNAVVDLNWNDNSELDLAGYNVYRSTSSGGPYSKINGPLVTASDYSDTSVTNGITYYYVVAAVDTSNNESADSNEASASPSAGVTLLLTFLADTSVPGVGTVANEDIVAYNTGSGTWSLYFDGSDVGLSSFAIDALAVLPSGDLLISVDLDGTLAGLAGGPSGTSVDDSDIVQFTPSSLGANTAGAWTFYFDGSDVGLTTTAEDIDALSISSSGQLVISTLDAPSVTGLSSLQDEDLIAFTPGTLGSATTGSWSYYFDGSDVGLSTNNNEDVDAACVTSSGEILLSTLGAFSVTGVSGDDEDVFQFTPTALGTATSGSFAAFLDLSTLGIATSADVNAVEALE
jgi:endonuclease I/fibronectin type 3 domain-containing protein